MQLSPTIHEHPLLQLLQKCSINLRAFNQVHGQIITTGLSRHTYPLSRLLVVSSHLSLPLALSIFNHIPSPTVFLFNTVICSCVAVATTNNNDEDDIDACKLTFSLYKRLLSSKSGAFPNCFTYPSLFKLCALRRLGVCGRALHAHSLRFLDPPSDQFVQSSLVNFYARIGEVGLARCLFDEIERPDLACWNSILAAYARTDVYAIVTGDQDVIESSLKALDLFRDMKISRVSPNEMTLVAVISACANLGALVQGTWAHSYLLRNNLKMNLFVATALLEMYSKCGCLDFALHLFDQFPQRDILLYNAMIGGFAIHGKGQQALDLFNRMTLEGLVPDDATFVVTISACSHVGLLHPGRRIFKSIKEIYGIEPKLEHYCCLVDLLGRSGNISEAEETVRRMPMKPNAILWRSLLGAARVHGNLEIGEVALRKLIELEPETGGNYVLLSNMYARADRWDDVNKLRRLMKHHGIDKTPGSSLVELNGTMHEFFTGDRTHPLSLAIYSKLEEISAKIQELGHNPETRDVLFDIEEEEKETALSYHSERLAISFALITFGSGVPIRIIKNLRVCGDCHAITKLISAIYEREIVVRDRTRFHHFKGGKCSCLDYW